MADISSQLVLNALSQAVAHAEGMPLHGSKSVPGLFPTNAAGKQAAARCQADGYLTLPSAEEPRSDQEPNGKARKSKQAGERCLITEKGLDFLLSQVSPRQVLEDLVRVLEARQTEMSSLLQTTQEMEHSLNALKANAEKVLDHVQKPSAKRVNGSPGALSAMFHQFLNSSSHGLARSEPSAVQGEETAEDAVMAYLRTWQASGASEDCPLPELFFHVQQRVPAMSLGMFHDALRCLNEAEQISLHPWTGPLYEMPEPRYALLIGHVVAYYASVR